MVLAECKFMYIEISVSKRMILYDISCGDIQYNETRRYMYIYIHIQMYSLSLCVCFNTYIPKQHQYLCFKAMPIEGRIVSLSSTISERTKRPHCLCLSNLNVNHHVTTARAHVVNDMESPAPTNHLVPPPGRGIGPLGFGIFGMPMGMSLAHTKQR